MLLVLQLRPLSNAHQTSCPELLICFCFLQVIVSPDADPPVVRIMDYKYDSFSIFLL
jgi:hypothetical protein